MPGAVEADAVIKDLDLDVGTAGVVAVDDGVEQGFARRGRRVGKAFFTLKAAVKFKCDADVRDAEFHGLVGGFEQGVGELPVVNDGARRFEDRCGYGAARATPQTTAWRPRWVDP